jgi:hypothetical protein
MMLLLAGLLLTASPEGRGVAPTQTPEARAAVRLHGAMGLIGAALLTQFMRSPSPGLTLEFGVTLDDRLTIAVRGHLTSVFVFTNGAATLGVDYALSDRWFVGAGLGAILALGVSDLPSAAAVQVPLRAQFAFLERPPELLSRRGPRIVLEVAPGYVLEGSTGFVRPAGPLPRWSVMVALGGLFVW